MAAYNKFNSFVEAVHEKKHDLSIDVFKIMLTNVAPVATNSIKTDWTEIAAGNGYTAGGTAVTVSASSQTGGSYTAVLSGDTVFTASGGNIANFQYAVLYNDTATNDELVSWWDYGSSITPADGETFTVSTNAVTLITAS